MLPSIKCRKCNKEINSITGVPIRAYDYESCLRKCERCQVAYSNAKNNPTMICQNIKDAIPTSVLNDVDTVLKSALNSRNHSNKIKKFTFETSEDAITWVLLKHLVEENKVSDLLSLIGIPTGKEQIVYLWGVCISGHKNDNIRNEFISTSDKIGEYKTSRSEPDVIIFSPNHSLAIIEVKYKSNNDVTTKLDKQDKYLNHNTELFEDIHCAKLSGHYELLRNWVFGCSLAKSTPFYLVNLGLPKLFEKKSGSALDKFIETLSIKKGQREFIKYKWSDLLSDLTIENDEVKKYLDSKFG